MNFYFIIAIIINCSNLYFIFYLQLEKEDALNEVDLQKEKVEKCQKAMYEAVQDKNSAKDELDRVMEKYDR